MGTGAAPWPGVGFAAAALAGNHEHHQILLRFAQYGNHRADLTSVIELV